MSMPILNELRFNLVIWILITAYGATGLGNFFACLPDPPDDDDEFFKFNESNYTFRLISSLIFFFLGISQFRYITFVYLTGIEIVIISVAYLHIMISRDKYLKKKNKKLHKMNKKRSEEFHNR